MASSHKFKGLESNPEVLNEFIRDGGSSFSLAEIFSLDEEMLSLVPRPVHSVILLFPDNRANTPAKEEAPAPTSSDIYFMKQVNVGNACGIIAILHALGNSSPSFGGTSFFRDFIEKTKKLDAFAKCVELGKDNDIIHAAEKHAQGGQTEASAGDANLDYHYISFVNVGNTIYELDGTKCAPVSYGPTTADTFLEDCAVVIRREYMDKQDTIEFNMMALVDNQD